MRMSSVLTLQTKMPSTPAQLRLQYHLFTAITLILYSSWAFSAKAEIKYAAPGVKSRGNQAFYVKTVYSEALLEIINGKAYTIDATGQPYIDLGKARFITRNIIELQEGRREYYCRKDAFLPTIAKLSKQYGGNIEFECKHTGIIDTASTQRQQPSTAQNFPIGALSPSFPGTGSRRPGVWVKKVFKPVIETMRGGKNMFGHGVVQVQIISKDPGTSQELRTWFSINCHTRNWDYLEPDAKFFGGAQEMFGKFSFTSVGTWACNRYGFKY